MGCPSRHFRLPDMEHCHAFLKCEDFNDVTIGEFIANGTTKRVYAANWQGHTVTMSTLSKAKRKEEGEREEFHHDVKMLTEFSGSPYVSQILGSCDNQFITASYPYGSLLKFKKYLEHHSDRRRHLASELCKSYVEVMNFLHDRRLPLLLCSSVDLNHTLTQFLITVNDRVVINDVDSLTPVGERGVVCKNHALKGNFVAPEQHWPFGKSKFVKAKMPTYDEKSDIWKIPEVCGFLYDTADEKIDERLNNIFAQCKSVDPKRRPSALEILKTFHHI